MTVKRVPRPCRIDHHHAAVDLDRARPQRGIVVLALDDPRDRPGVIAFDPAVAGGVIDDTGEMSQAHGVSRAVVHNAGPSRTRSTRDDRRKERGAIDVWSAWGNAAMSASAVPSGFSLDRNTEIVEPGAERKPVLCSICPG